MCDKTLAIHETIKVAELFWEKYDNKNKGNSFWSIFRSIVELTKNSPELEANKPEECYFSTEEIWRKFEEIADRKEGKVDSSRLGKEYTKLIEQLECSEVMLTNIAIESEISFIPEILKENNTGGQGKQTNYRLSAKPINTEIAFTPIVEIKKVKQKHPNHIEYYIESTPKLLPWARWIQHLNFEKYPLFIAFFISSPYFVAVVVIILFGFMSKGIWLSFGGSFITYGAIYIVFFMLFFRYFITAFENNIALLPDWMLPLKLTSAVLQHELNKPGSGKLRIKAISVKVYSAKCPICNHRIIIKSIGFPFNQRLIGQCDLNPLEHRYSFDFTNLTGKKLR